MTEGFHEFLRERRERAERTRRLLVIALGVACVTLTVSNVVLAWRLSTLRTTAGVETPAPAASIPLRAQARPAANVPKSAESEPSATAPPATTPPGLESSPAADAPTATTPHERESARPRRTLPPRAAPAPAPGPLPPEETMAEWMRTTYGHADAEGRARAALAFYDAQSGEGRYWRRVLAQLAAAR